jgi:UPF0176 protein
MRVLHNRISNEELKRRLYEETEPRTTVSFYQYFYIAEPQAFRDNLFIQFEALKVFGRIYIASEGINAQMSVPSSNFEAFKEALYAADPALNGIRLNVAVDDDGKSFWVLRMKVREKIVADGIDDPTFDMANKGKYLKAAEANEMMAKPDTIIVDMRNHYEYEVGHFEKAIEVPSDTFRQQLPMAAEMLSDKKDQNIVMYCTGGIRCEKASAYMLHQGFQNVYHIEGGIIEYTNKAKQEGLPLMFKGKNFVFDERLGERITDDVIAECHQCGSKADTHTNCKNEGCHLLFIQCPECAAKYEGCCSEACQDTLKLTPEERAELRKGKDNGQMIFSKSKDHPLRKHRDEWKKEAEAKQ